jgi:two-component system, chemotaxis family, CheB/CheR fusion protein
VTLTANSDFEAVLDYLRQNRGFDFTGYKRTTLVRRVAKRVQQLGIDSFTEYLDYLQVHTDEFPLLFNTILINVTEFFRDAEPWQYLAKNVIPELTKADGDDLIRVWSAGCASGQEPYSVAILLCEALGPDQFAERVKIYATDVDEDALNHARTGYTAKEMESVPAQYREKYFEVQGGRWVFKATLRRALIFGRHDLVQDAPISRLDLLICRNTLMYFTAESQSRILTRFHYALKDTGYLFLGRAEMLLTHGSLFRPADMKNRIFVKVPRVQLRDRLMMLANAPAEVTSQVARQVRLRELADEASPTAQIVLDEDGVLTFANAEARALLNIAPSDVGRPLKDLQASYAPLELRSQIDRAISGRSPVEVTDVEVELGDGARRYLHVRFIPLLEDDGGVVGTNIVFTDTSALRRLQADLERSRNDVETAYEELQSSNEELETTNEELQSTVEELETTNEELQSSNEELETMNEELESTNSELQTINDDLRQRTDEVDRLNAFMEAILTSLKVGVVAVNSEGIVTLWNARSEDLWGLRAEEAVDKPFVELDLGVPMDKVGSMVDKARESNGTGEEVVFQALNRRGRATRVKVLVTPLADLTQAGSGAVVVMEELEAG